jgi:hypothetical protein
MAAMTPPMSSKRSVSTSIHVVSIGVILTVAWATTPVRPMAPAVAQNSSGSWSGPIRWTPAGVARVSVVTWRQKLPSRWWFLPWTSAAMAPATLTWRVPGETGTNQPSGSERSRSWWRLVPPPTVTRPEPGSIGPIPESRPASTTVPPAHCAASP